MRRCLLFILIFFSAVALPQQSNTLYYMYRAPESLFLNPARQFPCQFYMSVPLLSSIHVNYSNTAFSVKSMADITGNTMQINTDKILKHVHNLDHISTEFHYTLFSFGFKKFDYYYSFSLTEKNELSLSLPNDLSQMVILGNGNSSFLDKNKTLKLNRLGVDLFHYREYAFGASKQISEDFQVGFRVKLLFGKANINTRVKELTIHTDPNSLNIDIHSKAKLNASGPINIATNTNGYISDVSYDQSASIPKLIFNWRNPGLALDGGFFYNYNENITLSGSFNDLGFIWWRSYLNNAMQQGNFVYNGQTEANVTNQNLVMHIIDTVRTLFAPTFSKHGYVTMLPLKLYLGTEYKISNTFRAGILGRLWVYQYRIHPSVTLHASATLTRMMTLTATYSFNNYNIRNLGAGITLQTRNIQFYALTDNYAGLIWWKSARNLNARFGFNLFFGCQSKKGKHHAGSMKCAGCYWYQSMEEKRKRRD
jgi:hypothetical protein